MTYRRTSDFDVTNPEELRRDLQQMDREVEQAFKGLSLPLYTSVRTIISGTVARFGELLRVDCRGGSVDVTVPAITPLAKNEATKTFAIARLSGNNTVTVRAVATGTINRGNSYTVPSGVGMRIVLFDGTEYWT